MAGPKSLDAEKIKNRSIDKRTLAKWRKVEAKDMAIGILAANAPGQSRTRYESLAAEMLDNPDVDWRIKFEVWRTLANQLWGRPGQAKLQDEDAKKPSIVEVPTSMTLAEWNKLVEQGEVESVKRVD